VVYIDVIVAAQRGAAYRLLCDLIGSYRREQPERRLVVVLMSVVSSSVLKCYARWGFSYGGIIDRGSDELPVVVDKLKQLSWQLERFEVQLARYEASRAEKVDPELPNDCSAPAYLHSDHSASMEQ